MVLSANFAKVLWSRSEMFRKLHISASIFSLAFPGLVFHGSVPFSFILSNGTPISSILFLTTLFFVALPKFCLHFHFSSSFGIVFSDFLLPSSYLLTVLSSLFSLPHHFLRGIKSSMAFSFTWTSLWAPYNCIDKPDRGAWFNKTPRYFQAVNSLEDNQLMCGFLIIKIQKCILCL